MLETHPTPDQRLLEKLPGAVDSRPEDRPGVPRESAPHPLQGAHWTQPSNQPVLATMPIRADLDHPTPVFSTALPLHGLSGKIRAKAYNIPDVLVRHWLLLLLADRIETIGTLFKPTSDASRDSTMRENRGMARQDGSTID